MGKDIENNLVGQLIFKQIIIMLPKDLFDRQVKKHSDEIVITTHFKNRIASSGE